MNTAQLDCFLAVAETLNFARAAEKLNVTQPAVTQQIQSLEQELNVKLFKRTTRKVEITQAGTAFIDDAKTILHISTRAKRRYENPEHNKWLFFTIGCHTYAEMYSLCNPLKNMAENYPTFHPIFHVVPFEHLYQLLENEDVDVILTFEDKAAKKDYMTYRELAKAQVIGVMRCP